MTGHWLDRLAVRATRRDAFKVAAAGAAIVSLPRFLRPAPAAAADGCRQGCRYTAIKNYNAQMSACDDVAPFFEARGFAIVNWPPLAFVIAPEFIADWVQINRCHDRAVSVHKAAVQDCFTPGCGSFNPYAAGGPCVSCSQGGVNCCECPTIREGYMCCVFACEDKSHSCCPK